MLDATCDRWSPRLANPTKLDYLNSGKNTLCKSAGLSGVKFDRILMRHGDNLDEDDALVLAWLTRHSFLV